MGQTFGHNTFPSQNPVQAMEQLFAAGSVFDEVASLLHLARHSDIPAVVDALAADDASHEDLLLVLRVALGDELAVAREQHAVRTTMYAEQQRRYQNQMAAQYLGNAYQQSQYHQSQFLALSPPETRSTGGKIKDWLRDVCHLPASNA